MINIFDKKHCCGCSACVSICPKHCITLESDNEGFLYPKINKDSCINCNLCNKVCNYLNPLNIREPIKVFAAVNNNDEILLKSSSGGIFTILAESTINEGGVVFGAKFDENWQVTHDYTKTIDGIDAFRGSKYVQSIMGDNFKKAELFLKEGRKVLFSGTPCQISGLKHYLRKEYDNLLTVDFICHGVPSPKVWSKYLKEKVRLICCQNVFLQNANFRENTAIKNISFRNKISGWKQFSFTIKLINKNNNNLITISEEYTKNTYMHGFLQDLYLRPSCYSCPVKCGKSGSDVTIADFWGIHTIFPEMDNDKGTGLVFINTHKGLNAYVNMTMNIFSIETSYKQVKSLNPACYRSPKPHQLRDIFFNRLDSDNVIELIAECTQLTLLQKINKYILNTMTLIYKLIKKIWRILYKGN